ncbi:MAG: serine protease [Conexibacter sp.]|nr:serine protease [Conexibacter sp.]
MRRVLAPVLPLLVTLLAVVPATASAATATNRLIGGVNATTTDVPWQVLVLPGSYLCGGAILDPTHVVTAAHCVYDEQSMTITAPSSIAVHAGITNRFSAGQHPAVVGVSVNPAYDPDRQTGDAAVLTLAGPGFALDATVQPIALTDLGYRPAAGDNLRLSGWGSNQPRSPYDDVTVPHPVDDLQVASTLHVNGGCPSVYQPFDDNLLLCAGQADLDACQGDSGGPLAVQAGGVWKLAGIVTGGAGCAWEGFPGYYARVASPSIHDFLTQRGVGYTVSAPVNAGPPTVNGTPKPGNVLTCGLGTWQNAYAYDVAWVAGGSTVLRGSTTMFLGSGLVGANVSCVVVAWGLTGSAQAQSAPVTILSAGNAAPVPPTAAPLPSVAVPAPDQTAPTAHLLKLRCARTLCILDVRVTDPAPSSGIRGVEGTVTTAYRTTCKVRHQRKRCTKTVLHRLKTVLLSAGTYKITTPKLRKGKQTFSLVATDIKNNRSKPATASRTTR